MVISWGTNTVHTFGSQAPSGSTSNPPAPSPAAGGFGSGAASSSAFGSQPFGQTPAAASTTGSFFSSSTPAPAPSLFGAQPSGSLFGSPSATPAPGTSLFGNAPSSSSLFGNTAPASAFGAPSTSLFGPTSAFGASQQQQQQQQQPQIPAQAAMYAHMEAMNRAETEKIKAELTKIYSTYMGTIAPSDAPSSKKNNFVSIVYNDLTQEQRQLQWMHSIGAGGKIMPIAPPRPPQVSEEEWNKAVVQNPDPLSYMPIPLVGADSLSARVSWQQERAKQLAKDAEMVKVSHETAEKLFVQGHKRLEDIKRTHADHRKRLLNVMRKVEVVRCMNQSLQPDEVRVMERLRDLDKQVRDVRHLLGELESRSRSARPAPSHHHPGTPVKRVALPDREQLAKVLSDHREELKKLTLTMQKDVRDVELMKERVVPKVGLPPTR